MDGGAVRVDTYLAQTRDLLLVDVPGDGNCLYHALHYQRPRAQDGSVESAPVSCSVPCISTHAFLQENWIALKEAIMEVFGAKNGMLGFETCGLSGALWHISLHSKAFGATSSASQPRANLNWCVSLELFVL
eukprot:2032312-Amphidinium_carterae.1